MCRSTEVLQAFITPELHSYPKGGNPGTRAKRSSFVVAFGYAPLWVLLGSYQFLIPKRATSAINSSSQKLEFILLSLQIY